MEPVGRVPAEPFEEAGRAAARCQPLEVVDDEDEPAVGGAGLGVTVDAEALGEPLFSLSA